MFWGLITALVYFAAKVGVILGILQLPLDTGFLTVQLFFIIPIVSLGFSLGFFLFFRNALPLKRLLTGTMLAIVLAITFQSMLYLTLNFSPPDGAVLYARLEWLSLALLLTIPFLFVKWRSPSFSCKSR
jgi:hypothetical protein